MNEVAERQEQQPATTMLALIEKAISTPNLNPDNLQKMLDIQMQMMGKQAEIEFNQAMTRLQAKLPVVDKKGRIEFVDKHGELRSTPFARYEDIDEAIRPLLREEGFSLDFDSKWGEQGCIIYGTISHKEGHKKTAEMRLPLDTSGSKNNLQAMGSTLSYGKRYLVGMLLNIVTKGEDTDGVDRASPLDPEQVAEINKLIVDCGADRLLFLKYMGVKLVDDIKAIHFNKAKLALEQKRTKGAKK